MRRALILVLALATAAVAAGAAGAEKPVKFRVTISATRTGGWSIARSNDCGSVSGQCPTLPCTVTQHAEWTVRFERIG